MNRENNECVICYWGDDAQRVAFEGDARNAYRSMIKYLCESHECEEFAFTMIDPDDSRMTYEFTGRRVCSPGKCKVTWTSVLHLEGKTQYTLSGTYEE